LLVVVGISFFIIGIVRFGSTNSYDEQQILKTFVEQGKPVTLIGLVVSDPIPSESSQRFVIETQYIVVEEFTFVFTTRISVRASIYYDIHYAQYLFVKGTLNLPDAFETEQGRTFDYHAYLAKDQIFATLSFAQIEVHEEPFHQSLTQQLTAALYRLKHSLIQQTNQLLPQPEAGLLAGLLFGQQGMLNQEMEDVFRTVGLTHIIVLSGYNVSLVIQLCMNLLSFLSLRIRSILAVIAIICFALLVGAGPTVVRASIMALFLVAAEAFGRRYDVVRALCVAGFLMVVWNPRLLVFDLSFQLSFLATFSLLYISPLFERWFSFLPNTLEFRSSAVATCSAQVMVTPLILYQIGEFSIISPVVNSITLFAVPWAMLFGFLSSLGIASNIIAVVAYIPLHFVVRVSEYFANIPHVIISVPGFPVSVLVGSYGLIGLWLYYQKVKNDRNMV
jgi:competence protein ComEC